MRRNAHTAPRSLKACALRCPGVRSISCMRQSRRQAQARLRVFVGFNLRCHALDFRGKQGKRVLFVLELERFKKLRKFRLCLFAVSRARRSGVILPVHHPARAVCAPVQFYRAPYARRGRRLFPLSCHVVYSPFAPGLRGLALWTLAALLPLATAFFPLRPYRTISDAKTQRFYPILSQLILNPNKNGFSHGLKIRVSPVRSRPWPPLGAIL